LFDAQAEICNEPIPDGIRRILERAGMEIPKGATFAHVEMLALNARALAGDAAAAKVLVELTEGAPDDRK
jgi:hypothetical protein